MTESQARKELLFLKVFDAFTFCAIYIYIYIYLKKIKTRITQT